MEIFSKKRNSVRAVSFIAVALTVISGVLNGILHVMFFEENVYMYKQGSEGVWSIYYILCAVTVAFFSIICAVNRRSACNTVLSAAKGECSDAPSNILRVIAGAIFAVGAVMRFVFFLTEKQESVLPEIIVVIMMAFFLCLSFYFFPQIDSKLGIGGFTAFCGILGVVAFIIDTLSIYADMSIPIASEYRLFTAVFTVLFLLALVLELRIKITEPNPIGYLAITSIASAVGGSTCIGRTVSIISGKSVCGAELARTVCGLGITVYLLSRLVSIAFTHKNEECPECRDGMPLSTTNHGNENEDNEEK